MTTTTGQVVFLSALLRHPVRDQTGRDLGRLSDIIVTLPTGGAYPAVRGLLLAPGERDLFVSADRIAAITEERIELGSATVDLRPFQRRDGEVLLRADILGHRLIDLDRPRLVRAYDVALTGTSLGWVVTGVDLHRAGWWQRLTDHTAHPARDWASFEALIGHQASATHRGPLMRLRRLKAAQIADLLEAASRPEQSELLTHVHADPDLEADVFEELDDKNQSQLLATRSDSDIAAVLARMNPDDAADALIDLPQDRRRPVLDALPEPHRSRVTGLLGYAEQTAGGLMTTEYVTLPAAATAADAVTAVRTAAAQPQTLTSVYLLDHEGRLTGAVTLIAAVQADPGTRLDHIADNQPNHVAPQADIIEITLLMADYNLLQLPVVDPGNHHLLGVITVDDALEAAIPEDWRHREYAQLSRTPDTATLAPHPKE